MVILESIEEATMSKSSNNSSQAPSGQANPPKPPQPVQVPLQTTRKDNSPNGHNTKG